MERKKELEEQIKSYENHIKFCLKEIESHADGDHRYRNPVREIRSCLKIIEEYRQELESLNRIQRLK